MDVLDNDRGFRGVRRRDGYLPIADHGLIGDGTTAALVGLDGGVSWLCVPRFDAEPLFCGILDHRRGGAFTVAPEGLVEARQAYVPDTGVLVTELRGPRGLVRLTDALTLLPDADLHRQGSAGRGELVRRVEVVEGEVGLHVEVDPRGDVEVERAESGLRLGCVRRPELDVELVSTRELSGPRSTLELRGGDRLTLGLRWGERTGDPDAGLEATIEAWRRWLGSCFGYTGPQEPLVRRSAITLKLLDYLPTGALVAAPTSSLPEAIGGVRNWDYRFSWIRDAGFSVYAFQRIGMQTEARSFLHWVLEAMEAHGGGRPRVLYDLDGRDPPPEREDPELEGYRASPPVRWGNAAAEQRQHDVFGEVLDCAHQWVSAGGELSPDLWADLRGFVESAGKEWRDPDHGIWEVRTPGRVFTYSAAMCQVALDRGARLAERLGYPGDTHRWREEAETIRTAILEEAWDPEVGSLTEHLGGGALDASLLALPIRRVIPPDHPRMVATTKAVVERLGAGDGLLYRYLPDESPDGLPGHEGAFLLCSFWLVDNLAHQGRLDEASELYESLCDRANHLGLLPEQIEPADGSFLGNFPQAFSHIGIISSGYNLQRLYDRRGSEA